MQISSRRSILERVKLPKLPKLPVRDSFDKFLDYKESDYQIDKSNKTAFSIPNISKTSLVNKVRKMVAIECHGFYEPNPSGIGCWAFVAFDENRNIIHQAYGDIGSIRGVANNVAGCVAVIAALDWARSLACCEYDVKIISNSKLVVNQINGEWSCNAPHLNKLLGEAYELMCLNNAYIEWSVDEINPAANALSKAAYRAAFIKYEGGKNDQ